jgi:hypothetical protein
MDREHRYRVCVCRHALMMIWPRWLDVIGVLSTGVARRRPSFPRQSRHNVVPLSDIVHPTSKYYARVHAYVRSAPCVISLVRLTCVCVYQGRSHSRSLAGTVAKYCFASIVSRVDGCVCTMYCIKVVFMCSASVHAWVSCVVVSLVARCAMLRWLYVIWPCDTFLNSHLLL